jgi:hypothetical protein
MYFLGTFIVRLGWSVGRSVEGVHAGNEPFLFLSTISLGTPIFACDCLLVRVSFFVTTAASALR